MDVEDLQAAGVREPIEDFETALEALANGARDAVALVGPPYDCQSAFLSHAVARLDGATRIRLSDAPASEQVELPEGGVVVIDDCQQLYTRQVGGFDALDTFLQRLATTECVVVTSWNQYAWRYLRQARDVASMFPVEISMPTLSASELVALFETMEPELPAFVAPETLDTAPSPSVDVSVFGRQIHVPVPALGSEAETTEPREAFFERLATVSGGLPGVAKAIWDTSVAGEQVSPDMIPDPPTGLALSDSAAFVLTIVVSKGSVRRDTLARVVPDGDIDRALHRLDQQGLVERTEDGVAVSPSGLVQAVSYLERRRLLW